jgi:hypothetical protein
MTTQIVRAEESETAKPLSRLEGQRLTQVWFVMDYVELIFDEGKLSRYQWPTVELPTGTYDFGDRDYRNGLCSFITLNVEEVLVKLRKRNGDGMVETEIRLRFGVAGTIRVPLDKEEGGPSEIAAYNDPYTAWLVW